MSKREEEKEGMVVVAEALRCTEKRSRVEAVVRHIKGPEEEGREKRWKYEGGEKDSAEVQ
eukprot:3530589-Rhodomonas_salina.1